LIDELICSKNGLRCASTAQDALHTMIKVQDVLQLSASDLVGHLNCRHLTELSKEVVSSSLRPPKFRDPFLELLQERGAIFERSYIQHLSSAGYEIVHIEGVGITASQAQRTRAAMNSGAQVIVQAALSQDLWSGRIDILRRIDTPSDLGDWSYEIVDTKLARETKGGTVLQLCLYADLLAAAQGMRPEHVYVVTPGSGFQPLRFRTDAYAAYYRYVKRSLEASLQRKGSTYPDPNEHCEGCRWRVDCESRRRQDDHLSLVAGITKIQIAELKRRNVATATALASVQIPLTWRPDRGVRQSYERSREQARVQLEGRVQGKPIYETIAPAPGIGLAHLPAPSVGDIFFDLEADPFVDQGGLEYLFGYVTVDTNGELAYVGEWAVTREEERRAFERFVDFVMNRWARYPDLHIYHYAAYEPSALKRLMGRYATREEDVDRMLRGGLFVDLYTVIRQGVRASIESYTIKNLEVFYGFSRTVALEESRRALMSVQACLELDNAFAIEHSDKTVIAGYNRDDCVSAFALRNWLEEIRSQLVAQGIGIERPANRESEASESVSEWQQKVADLVTRLTSDVAADPHQRTEEEQARWVLAYSIDWHRRELKPAVWEKFRLAGLPEEELLYDRAGIAGLTLIGTVGGTASAPVHRYQFPPQDIDLRRELAIHMCGGDELGELEDYSLSERTIDIKKRVKAANVHATAVFGVRIVNPGVLPGVLLKIGEHVAQRGIAGNGQYQAARDLLLRRPPAATGRSLRREGETALDAAIRLVTELDAGVLAIQGPPGAGKTFTAAHMICALVGAGKRVGVTANGHQVIRTVLDKVVEVSKERGLHVACIQKPKDKQDDVDRIRFTQKNEDVFAALKSSCQVAGGTAWLWARDEAFESVDVLFVDEAAQMSMANVLAVSQACRTLVLIGDPCQLEQPMQGSHPDGTDVSALDYLLAGKPTVSEEQGLFIEETRRLHPDICAFTSELFYEGRLRAHAGLDRQRIQSPTRISGTGLRFLPVPHTGNQSSAPQEADRIRDLVNEILAADTMWTDRDGAEHRLEASDILIIAPYNAQVFELQERLPGYRIGTVDKFQGQEAPIVVYSMTTSSHSDAPRGMEFLYSLNRLNVATSRAQCLCILVGSPALFEPECKTPRQMELANAFCRYLEMSTVI
jgi:predicted RecB family nuclease